MAIQLMLLLTSFSACTSAPHTASSPVPSSASTSVSNSKQVATVEDSQSVGTCKPQATEETRGNFKLVDAQFAEGGESQSFAIKAKYPQIKGSATKSASDFNAAIKAQVSSIANDFKNTVKQADNNQSGSTLILDYKATLANENVVSVVFTVMTRYAWGAYADVTVRTFNYDLRTNQALRLADLFKPATAYLQEIAKQTTRLIDDIGEKREIDLSAKAENFTNWNLTADSLIFNFELPHAMGSNKEVRIPAINLSRIIKPESVWQNYIKSSSKIK